MEDMTEVEKRMTWPHIETGEGWYRIIREAVEKMVAIEPSLQISQIKEKFGGLRIYTTSWRSEFDAIIREAEAQALVTCETCGEPGVLRSKNRGWLRTLCDADAKPDDAWEVV